MKNITQPLKVIALALVLSVGISYVSAWTAPTATPPSSNVAAPINVGSTAQTKTGNLTANYLAASSESNAPVFKDSNDPTNFFVNPNGDSILWNAYAKGDVCSGWGSGSQKCLSTVSGLVGPAGPAGATGPAGSAATIPQGTLCGFTSTTVGANYINSATQQPCMNTFYPAVSCPSGYARQYLANFGVDGNGGPSGTQIATCVKS